MTDAEREALYAGALAEAQRMADARAYAETGVWPNGEPNLGQTVAASQPLSYDEYIQHANRQNLAAYPRSGPNYAPVGVREAYENYGIPPVVQQSDPYATAAFRTFVNPWGQIMVQPLVGFPSRYPHVLSGVPTNLTNELGWAMSLLGPLPQMQLPQPAQPAPRAPVARGNGNPGTTRPANTNTQQNTTQQPPVANQWVHYGDKRAKADAMPVSPENQAAFPEIFGQPPVQPQTAPPPEEPWINGRSAPAQRNAPLWMPGSPMNNPDWYNPQMPAEPVSPPNDPTNPNAPMYNGMPAQQRAEAAYNASQARRANKAPTAPAPRPPAQIPVIPQFQPQLNIRPSISLPSLQPPVIQQPQAPLIIQTPSIIRPR